MSSAGEDSEDEEAQRETAEWKALRMQLLQMDDPLVQEAVYQRAVAFARSQLQDDEEEEEDDADAEDSSSTMSAAHWSGEASPK
eukprot:COSAG06_NODE_23162_length_701_cov_0.774086_2_plen_84_part_00